MNDQTADLLLRTLTYAFRVANENTLKLRALESVLKQHQSELFRLYREETQSLLVHQDLRNLTLTIDALRKGLLQG